MIKRSSQPDLLTDSSRKMKQNFASQMLLRTDVYNDCVHYGKLKVRTETLCKPPLFFTFMTFVIFGNFCVDEGAYTGHRQLCVCDSDATLSKKWSPILYTLTYVLRF